MPMYQLSFEVANSILCIKGSLLVGGSLIFSESLYDKIVTRRRGDWCHELNGIFCWALREIGFRVTMLSGRYLHLHNAQIMKTVKSK